MVTNVNDVLDGHVGLDLECLDRIYLNGYVPNLQVSGQVVTFMTRHLGNPLPSPALYDRIGRRFRDAVGQFAASLGIPIVRFKKERKIDEMRSHFAAAKAPGIVAIGVAQEFQRVFTAYDRNKGKGPVPSYVFEKADRRVTAYYFYILDAEFGPSFIKICSYFPYPAKVWLNGHEWAKRQAAKAGIAFTALSNGFATCDDPRRLQRLCDRLGPWHIQRFFDHWMARIPVPLTRKDRRGGYWWELSMRQVETSRTLVFDAPRHARSFFEALVADNLDIGRPDEVQVIFGRRVQRNTPGTFKTRVVTRGVDVTVNVFYKRSRIKEYLKDGRALRVETVINDPTDLGVQRRLRNLPELQVKARDANDRLLSIQRVGQGCAIASPLFERVALPSQEGQRTGALRFGDPRVMALTGALCQTLGAVTGFTNRSLRAHVAGLLGTDYTASQMSYDLRRLTHKGVIGRVPHTNRYHLTPDGARIAVFYTKVHNRLLRPLLGPDKHKPPELQRALRQIDTHLQTRIADARITQAA